MNESQPLHQEIIIVRRGGGGDAGGHHGGAWKIAYADFVTAMMAFFLVMWLINSANEVTKSRVASYFNPIKMTDSAPSDRGLKNNVERKSSKDSGDAGEVGEPNVAKPDGSKPTSSESGDEAVLQNPFSAIESIVADQANMAHAGSIASNDRDIGDPFEPRAWETLRKGKPADEDEKVNPETGKLTGRGGIEKYESTVSRIDPLSPEKSHSPEAKGRLTTKTNSPLNQQIDILESAVSAVIEKHKAEGDVTLIARRTDEGLLIVLGDNSGKGMFAIGSAKPSAALIDIVGTIGKILSQLQGDVVIRGHTDNRKFRSTRFDNWQLSTARAHMASYMLMRGGLAEGRVERIEGYGASKPLHKLNASADSNRRVEFLLVDQSENP